MVFRLLVSLFLVIGYTVFRVLYAPFENIIRGQLGVGQLSNNPITVGTALAASQNNLPVSIAGVILIVVLAIIWLPPFIRFLTKLTK